MADNKREGRKSPFSWLKERRQGKPDEAGSSRQGQKLSNPALPVHPKPQAAGAGPAGDSRPAPLPRDATTNVSLVPAVPSGSGMKSNARKDDYSNNPLLLWNEAYEALKSDEATQSLVEAYESFLRDPNEGLVDSVSLLNGRSGPEQMEVLLQRSLEKTASLDKVEGKISSAVDIVLSVKSTIGLAISSIPIAAAAWTPICITLQMFSKAFAEGQANLDGIVEIVKKMKWYSSLSLLLLEDTFKKDERYHALQSQLADRIRELYKLLLEYIIKTICVHSQNVIFRVTRRMFSNWKAKLDAVNEAERSVTKVSGIYHSQQTNTYLQLLLNLQVSRERSKMMSKLYIRNMDDEMKALENRKDQLIPDSYQWILDRDSYKRFIDRDSENKCQVLWIKGDAGMGKTMLVIGLIRELDAHFDLPCLSYFFCQGTDNQLNTATAILKGLMWMLLCRAPSLFQYLEAEVGRSGDRFLSDIHGFPTLERIFMKMVCDKASERAVLVVDALDECKDAEPDDHQAGIKDLLRVIAETVRETENVRWLVSGRKTELLTNSLSVHEMPDDEIEPDPQTLPKANQSPTNANTSSAMRTQKYESIEVNPESVIKALTSYIDLKVHDLKAKYTRKPKTNAPRSEQNAFREQSDILDQVARVIKERTDGTFLWVALVLRELQNCEPSNMLQRLEEIPSELKLLYARIIKRISQSPYRESYQRIITVSVLAHRPLHIAELMMLGTRTRLESDETFLENCELLTVRDGVAHLLHQSTLDYLNNRPDDEIKRLFPNGYAEGHNQIVERSLEAMKVDLANEDSRSKSPSTPVSELSDLADLAVIQYSCLHWIDHLCEMSAGTRSSVVYEGILSFLQNHVLEWVFALSLIQSIPRGLLSIGRLMDLLNHEQPKSQLSLLAWDLDRFLRLSKDAIEEFPLQLYSSALLFSPNNSIIRGLYRDHEPMYFTTKPIMDDDWDMCQHTYTGIQASAKLCFQARTFASASGSTIEIFDLDTGSCVQTLQRSFVPPSPPLPFGRGRSKPKLAYSRDGKLLASSAEDVVEIWDVAARIKLPAFEYVPHSQHVEWFEFSPVRPEIAISTSLRGVTLDPDRDSTTVSIWNVHNGPLVAPLIKLSYNPWQRTGFKYSADGEHLAIYGQSPILVWKVGASEWGQKTTIERAADSLAFSLDGKQLAIIVLWDARYVQIWNIEGPSALLVRQLEAADGLDCNALTFTSVAWSPDSRLVAAGSYDGCIWIWDTRSGDRLHTFFGHQRRIESICFSLDGAQLASVSHDHTIKLWSVPIRQHADETRNVSHRSRVIDVTISPNGLWFASRSADSLNVWDMNGVCVPTLERTRSDTPIAISPNSELFVSTCHHRTGDVGNFEERREGIVKVWKKSDCSCVKTLIAKDPKSKSICFSPAGNVIAALGKLDVEMWNLAETSPPGGSFAEASEGSGPPLLEGAIAFSADEKLLAVFSRLTYPHIEIRDLVDRNKNPIRLEVRMQCIFRASLAFSSNGERLLISADFERMEVWDIQNQKRVQFLHMRDPWNLMRDLSFVDNSPLVNSSRGTFLLPADAAADDGDTPVGFEPVFCGPNISADGAWIGWDDERVLWVPPAYRPTATAVHDRTVILGCTTGQVLVLTFEADFKPWTANGNGTRV